MNKTVKLGQFRKTQLKSYMTSLDYSIKDIETSTEYTQAVTFIDKGLLISNNIIATESYYLNFAIYRLTDSDQVISVYLKKSLEKHGDKQKLCTYTIERGARSESVPFELVISPAVDFDEVIFELQRTADDYSIVNPNGTYGRTIKMEVIHFTKIENILPKIKVSYLFKLGIQGPPGLLMSIEGEEIRIGRSGIYEMAYDTAISSIGFVVKDDIEGVDGQDYFIMDYQY